MIDAANPRVIVLDLSAVFDVEYTMCFDLEQAVARFEGIASGESDRSLGPGSPAASDTAAP